MHQNSTTAGVNPYVSPLSLLLESGGKRCKAADFVSLLLMRGSTSRRPHRPRRARRTHPPTTQPSFLCASQSLNRESKLEDRGRVQATDEGSRRRSTWWAGRGRDGSPMRFVYLPPEAAIEQEGRAGGEESMNRQAKVGHQGRCSAVK